MEVPVWSFESEECKVHIESHMWLVKAASVLCVITLYSQWKVPAPYGKFSQLKDWGPPLPQRLVHCFNDGVYGSILFAVVFFGLGSERGVVNWISFILWQMHFIHRGFVHPWMMNYSSSSASLGIFFCGVTLILFSYLNAEFVGNASYTEDYVWHSTFIFGLVIFIVGFIINRWSDYKLASLRANTPGCKKYYIPYGGLFELVSCPNYLGEMMEWWGWAILTWSPAGLVYALFATATFVPRARHTHQWYEESFRAYPPGRAKLLPGIW